MSLSHNPEVQLPPGIDLHADKGPYLIRVTIACIVLSFTAVVLRFLSRAASKQGYKADDWLMLAALPFAWTPGIQMINASKKYYLGRHIYVVEDPSKIEKFWLNLYIAELIYPFAIVLTKLSILLFLYRIFHIRKFKISAIVVGVIVLLWGLSTLLPATFTCSPIPSYWRPQAYSSHTCISTLTYFLGNVIPNLILDATLMLLPLPSLWTLRITLSQKIALSGVFMLGGFVTVVGAMRLATIARTQGTRDFTWDFVELGVWTSLEMNVGILGGCAPSLGPLLRFLTRGSFVPGSLRSGGSGRAGGSRRVGASGRDSAGRRWFGQRGKHGDRAHMSGDGVAMGQGSQGEDREGQGVDKGGWKIRAATEITVWNGDNRDSDVELEKGRGGGGQKGMWI